jgi:hypothetical protein
MKSKLVVLLLLLAYVGNSQTFLCLAKKADAKEWGYINEKGDFVIAPKYRKCFEFSTDGLAAVLVDPSKQYTFIKANGEPLKTDVTSFRLMEIFGFGVKGYNNGMVAIKIGDQWGFLNAQGKLAIQAKYEKVTEFYDGYACAEMGGKSYVIRAQGAETLIADAQVKDVKHFSEGLAPFNTDNRTSGFIDTQGQIVIPATFLSVGYFAGGLAWAKLPSGKIGYINKKGDWVIQPQFEVAKDFDPQSKMARARQDDQWVYVSDTGETLKMALDSYGDFAEGLCYGKQGKQVGFFDKKGTWVIAPQYEAVRDFKHGFAAAKQGGSWGMINTSGKWVISPQFDGIRDMELIK